MDFFTPANLLTLARIPLALGLLAMPPLSPVFFLLYVLSGVTDMLDGPVARRTHTESRTGAKLDSLADAVFLAAVLYRLLPVLHLSHRFLLALALICFLRCGAWLVGYRKYRRFAALHTLANKITGAALFCAPFLLPWFPSNILCVALCILAGLSAGEELAIQCLSTKFDPNIRSILHLHDQSEKEIN
ncbi:CDP-alcohol phosphatidyltransferase family protein [Dysosmobacter sp.]|uniref:CDP-alcohol phosphatidyltransferase family protein n=1 Tax=Dysosmobacter sp. TaxID=2591382 RepID=UPI002A968CEF|nr:CDP-alcohol phosphatidyltransferase family protein [Dysosmobacter sp.]MDY5612279.1 CDP-alcohol phosphatidyltransferase family protein [Dysosmobacter sp.]